MIFLGKVTFLMKCTSFTVLQSEIEKCCQEDNCLWIIEDSDLMDLPFDKTWPLSPFKYKVSYLFGNNSISNPPYQF